MKFRTLLLGLSALFVAFNAAFFSVSGLSKLFAGAAFSVIIMASSLELAKLITAGYLYNYWEKINKSFRIYLSLAVLILILITSLGIYGFLTSAFQDTFNQYSIKEKQLAFLQQKEKFWSDDVTRYDEELKRISSNIGTLSNAKSQSIQVRDTSVVGGVRTTISTSELRMAQKRIGVEEQNRKGVQEKREVASDSLQGIQLQILDLESMEGVSSELGPLEYLSGLLDRPMDQIINWFILIIIFVFDPLAVALVIAFNNAVKVDRGIVKKEKVIRKRELYDEVPEEEVMNVLDNDDLWDNTLQDGLDEDTWEERIEEPIEDIEVESQEVIVKDLDIDGDGIVSEDELLADTDGDGKISAEEYNDWYENKGGWKQPYNGKDYWLNPKFDWRKRERWINNQNAIKHWVAAQGGSYTKVQEYKKEQTKYPDNFSSKTY
jgi:hypothetical protein